MFVTPLSINPTNKSIVHKGVDNSNKSSTALKSSMLKLGMITPDSSLRSVASEHFRLIDSKTNRVCLNFKIISMQAIPQSQSYFCLTKIGNELLSSMYLAAHSLSMLDRKNVNDRKISLIHCAILFTETVNDLQLSLNCTVLLSTMELKPDHLSDTTMGMGIRWEHNSICS